MRGVTRLSRRCDLLVRTACWTDALKASQTRSSDPGFPSLTVPKSCFCSTIKRNGGLPGRMLNCLVKLLFGFLFLGCLVCWMFQTNFFQGYNSYCYNRLGRSPVALPFISTSGILFTFFFFFPWAHTIFICMNAYNHVFKNFVFELAKHSIWQ